MRGEIACAAIYGTIISNWGCTKTLLALAEILSRRRLRFFVPISQFYGREFLSASLAGAFMCTFSCWKMEMIRQSAQAVTVGRNEPQSEGGEIKIPV